MHLRVEFKNTKDHKKILYALSIAFGIFTQIQINAQEAFQDSFNNLDNFEKFGEITNILPNNLLDNNSQSSQDNYIKPDSFHIAANKNRLPKLPQEIWQEYIFLNILLNNNSYDDAIRSMINLKNSNKAIWQDLNESIKNFGDKDSSIIIKLIENMALVYKRRPINICIDLYKSGLIPHIPFIFEKLSKQFKNIEDQAISKAFERFPNDLEYLYRISKARLRFGSLTPKECSSLSKEFKFYNLASPNLNKIIRETDLLKFVRHENASAVKVLLKSGILVLGSVGWDALYYALNIGDKGNDEIAKMLIDAKCPINFRPESDINGPISKMPLHISVTKQNINLTDYILKQINSNANVKDSNGQTPLILATLDLHLPLIKLLLQYKKTDPDIKDNFGFAALHYISKLNSQNINKTNNNANSNITNLLEEQDNIENISLQIIDLLLASDADIDITDGQGNTPLMLAIENQNNKIATKLIDAKSDVMLVNDDDISPIMLASKLKNFEILAKLEKAQANKQDKFGDTPLIRIARTGNKNFVISLLKSGADASIKNNAGKTAIDIAQDLGHEEIANLLKNSLNKANSYC